MREIENTEMPLEEEGSPVHHLQQMVERIYLADASDQVNEDSPAGACLRPLLAALNWTGEAKHLREALPHFDSVSKIDGLRAVLAKLNYDTRLFKVGQGTQVRRNMLPCLCAPDPHNLWIILTIEEDGRYLIFDGKQQEFRTVDAVQARGDFYLISAIDVEAEQKSVIRYGWFQTIVRKFKKTIALLFVLTFAINVLALSVPLYIMNVYDKAIGSKSLMTLGYFAAGIAIAMAADLLFRNIRGGVLAYLGTRIEALLAIDAFQQLLNLPISMTETAPIGAQITRLKQFESIRDAFTGPLAAAILDIPFFIVFLIAIFVIAGPLGWLPVALVFLYLCMAAVTVPLTRAHVASAGEARSQVRDFLMELTNRYRGVRDNGGEDVWLKRFGALSSKFLIRQSQAQRSNFIVQTIAQALVMIAGAATVGIGTLLVMFNQLSAGALIAVMALVWRILSPLQAAFLSLNHVSQVIDSIKQVNHLMRITPERQTGQLPSFYRNFKGKLSFSGVGFRYNARSEPALRGINLEIKAGEIIAITGASGVGKSTLLNIITRLYQPQAGSVLLDDLDIRQIDIGELRAAIGFTSQKPQFFYGTIAQNLKLAHPTATQADMEKIFRELGAWETIQNLEDGLDTRLQGSHTARFPNGFFQQLTLARAFIKDAPIYLLDEPGSNLDRSADEALMNKLISLRGKSTVIMITHRPSHMRLADRVVVMNQGMIAADGPPDQILASLLGTGQKSQALANS